MHEDMHRRDSVLLPAHLHVTDQLCLHLYVIAASMCVNACICSLSTTFLTLLSRLLQLEHIFADSLVTSAADRG